MTTTLTCRWVPSTLDRVTVRTGYGEVEVSISRIKQVLGREALEGLYLKDSFVLSVEDPRYLPTLEALLGTTFTSASAAD